VETQETKTTTRMPSGVNPTVADDELEVEESSQSSRRGGARRRVLIVAGVIAALLVLFYGVRFLAYMTTHESTDDAYVDADMVTVTSKISEHVQAIDTDTNQYVKKGQLLIQLNDRDELARYDQALAAYNAQEATARAAEGNLALTRKTVTAQTQQGQGGVSAATSGLANAEDQVAVAQQGVAQAKSQLSAAKAAVPAAREALAEARANYDRTASLVKTGDLAQANLDAASAAFQQAQAQYQGALDNVSVADAAVTSAERRVAAAQSQVGVQQGQLTTAQGKLAESSLLQRVSVQQAQVNAAQAQAKALAAQLANAELQLNYTKIYAPISGYIGQKSVEIGQQVTPGTPLLTIVPLNNVYITANFKETQMADIRRGEHVDISVDAYPGVQFSGVVGTISPASQNSFALVPAQNATGNFVKVTQRIPVRIYVNSASKPLSQVPLRPGMSVVANVKIK
jgi:membrane fusion protein (multidrug efflux system)